MLIGLLIALQVLGYVGIVVGLVLLVRLGGETQETRQRLNRHERGL